MNEIRVNTSDLRNGSQSLNSAGGEIANVQQKVAGLRSQGGNSYDGQLRQALESIMGNDYQTSAQLHSRAIDLGNELLQRALGFEAANEAGRSAMLALVQQHNDFTEASSTPKSLFFLNGSNKINANILWGLGGLGLGSIFARITSFAKETRSVTSAIYLAQNLRWSPLRPNSIIFSGGKWLRKALSYIGIKQATRVIKPTTLAKGMALTGFIESGWDAARVIGEDLTDSRYQSTSQKISAALTDSQFRFAVSAVGTVGIPLLLSGIVALASPFVITAGVTAGTVVIAGGAIVLAGSVIGGMGYDKHIGTPAWEAWKKSSIRNESIEDQTRRIDQVINFTKYLHDKSLSDVTEAFRKPIDAIVSFP